MTCRNCKWAASCIMSAPDGGWEACGRFEAGDLIKREQAIATIDNLNAISFYEANEHSREAYKEMRTAIEHLPSAEKTGRWIDKGSLSCRCSECGCKSPKEYTYCPNCGARMEVDHD